MISTRIGIALVLSSTLVGCWDSHGRASVPTDPDAEAPGPDAGLERDAASEGPVSPRCGELGTQGIAAAALSPDGALYAYASFDSPTLLDARTGHLVWNLAPPRSGGSTYAMAFSDDASRLALVTTRGIRVLDVVDGAERVDVSIPEVEHGAIGGGLALVTVRSELVVVSLDDGAQRPLSAHLAPSQAFAVSPDGAVAAIGQGSSLALVRIADGATLRTLAVPADVVGEKIVFSPDGSFVAVAHTVDDGSRTRLHVASVDGAHTAAFVEREWPLDVPVLAWHPDGARLSMAHERGEAVEIELDRSAGLTLNVVRRLPSDTESAMTMAVAPDGRVLLSRDHVWAQSADGALLWLRAGAFNEASDHPFGLLPDGSVLASGVVWDLTTGLAIRALDLRRGRAAASRDGALAWIADGVLHVDGAPTELPLPFDPETLALDAAHVVIATGTEVAVIDRETGAIEARASHAASGRAILAALSPDAHFALVGGSYDDLRLIDLVSGTDSPALPSGLAAGVRGSTAAVFTEDARFVRAIHGATSLSRVALDGTEEQTVDEVVSPDAVTLLDDGDFLVVDALGLALVDGATFTIAGRVPLPGRSGTGAAVAASPDGQRVALTVRLSPTITVACLDPW